MRIRIYWEWCWLCSLVVGTLIYRCNGLDKTVEVFDNILPQETRLRLHQECKEWNNDDVIFEFPLRQPKRHSVIEQTINNILLEIYPNTSSAQEEGDAIYYVEYWERQDWFHILAHADMDEGLRNEQESKGIYGEPFAHPEVGHVLYLRLGNRVQGPTCVFSNTTEGGQLLGDSDNDGDTAASQLIVVPAVESRLLRFQGHLLHAVPRPADLWMAPTYEDETEPFEEWGRSVLLFNLWPIQKGPVRGKKIQQPSDRNDFTDAEDGESVQQLPGVGVFTACNPREDWQLVLVKPPEKIDDDENSGDNNVIATHDVEWVPIQFPLMGDEQRRGTEKLSVILETPESSRLAFLEERQPSIIEMRPRLKKRKKSWLSYFGVEL